MAHDDTIMNEYLHMILLYSSVPDQGLSSTVQLYIYIQNLFWWGAQP